uniref:T cell-interacting, activating receptor on myeloid cells 1 n=2 Tax=Nannospalax galili TaxID=1026970 RepID=A0A8C6RMY0_NANGA
MIPKLLSLLCFRLCVGQIDRLDNGPRLKPSLSAWPSSVVALRSSVTLQCISPTPCLYFILKKEGVVLKSSKPDDLGEKTADFHITELQQRDAGFYTCEYYRKHRLARVSPASDGLLLLVTGYLPKPSLQAHLWSTVTTGGKVTLRCQNITNVSGSVMFALLKVGSAWPVQTRKAAGLQLDFSLQNVTARDSGRYSCVYYLERIPFFASGPSDPLEISVTDPPCTKSEGYTMGNLIRLGMAAVVVLMVGIFLVEAWYSRRVSPSRP